MYTHTYLLYVLLVVITQGQTGVVKEKSGGARSRSRACDSGVAGREDCPR